ncbi:MAG: anthranilate phosphoribosyltransferase [Elusimicrobia bacterium]|nr:anthranilate phosphoribosyltransferase [Elusimicrobiota bacterium]
MSGALSDALEAVLGGGTLPLQRARRAMGAVLGGGATPSQTGAFIGALALRGPTCDEIVGFSQAVRELGLKAPVSREPLLETCGTGAAGAFNISTTVAFIAAGAGAAVAKQVSRSAGKRCGSADVLEALGVRADMPAPLAARCVEEAGVGFFLSSLFHPALDSVRLLRRELAVHTVFDLLEPLANPAGATQQLLGVYSATLVPMLARALQALGSQSAMVVSSRDGLDELSLAAPAVVARLRGGRIEEYEVDAATLGFKPACNADLAGGDAAANARILLGILRGERGPAFDVALLNAAAALMVAGRAADFKEGLARAAESVDSCRALQALEAVRKLSAP